MKRVAASEEMMGVLESYLDDARVLEYLDYPVLPGDQGDCGYLIQDGEIWERYHADA